MASQIDEDDDDLARKVKNGLMTVQEFLKISSERWRKRRSATQMTLGAMIDRLAGMPPDAPVVGLENPHSYRGYYSDLAFELPSGASPKTAASLLEECKAALGQGFEGYKGGNFIMGCDTPVWVAFYGREGLKLLGIRDDGQLDTRPDD